MGIFTFYVYSPYTDVVFHTDQPHILALFVFANAKFQRSKNQKS
jgi:hypothetical protein